MNSLFLQTGIVPALVEPVTVEFGEWLPDMPELNNPGAVEAHNVMPSEGGYVPFWSFTWLVSGITSPVRGAAIVTAISGDSWIYAGALDGIYVRIGNNLSKRYSTAFTLYRDNIWQFVQFGNSVIGLHPQISPVVSDVGGVSPFTPLGGTPPIAATGARVGDFLVLGNLSNEVDPGGTRWPSRIRWSAFNNIEAPWISDPATQADFNDMPSEGGRVVAITGREFGTIFQERCISRMSYVGLPTVFDIETVEEERGALSTGCVVDIGALVYFIASDGFFVWNGTNSMPIGNDKVNRWFFNKLNHGLAMRIAGAVDYANACVAWAFPTGNSNELDEIIIYSYKMNRWAHATVGMAHLMSSVSLDASLDDFPDIPSLDSFPDTISLDDGVFKGGRPWLGGFDLNNRYGIFSGPALAATLDTAESSGPTGRRVYVTNTRPIVDVGLPVVTISVAGRDQLVGGALTFNAPVAQEITGECPVIADARYMRFRCDIPAGATWRHALGVEVWRKATGAR